MPICQSCHQKWTYKDAVKKSLTLDTAMICPYCNEKQFPTPRTQKLNTIVLFIPPLLLFINFLIGPSVVILILLLSLIPILPLLYPLWLELSNKEKSLKDK